MPMEAVTESLSNIADKLEKLRFPSEALDLLVGGPEATEKVREKFVRRNTGIALMEGLRIRLCLKAELPLPEESLREFLSALKNISICWIYSEDRQYKEAVDLLTALGCPQEALQTRLPDLYSSRENGPLSDELLSVCGKIARYCMENEEPDALCLLGIHLAALSSRRNPGEVHRQLVIVLLDILVDRDIRATDRILREQQAFFEQEEDLLCAQFSWYAANTCLQQGDRAAFLPLVRRSHRLYLKEEGPGSWMAARTMLLEDFICVDPENPGDTEARLLDFLEKADRGFWDVDGLSLRTAVAMALKTVLSLHMYQDRLRNDYPILLQFRELTLREDFPVSAVWNQLRTAENYLCAYYSGKGDILSALNHCQAALDAVPPSDAVSSLSDSLILTSLLHLCTQAHDLRRLPELRERLADLLRRGSSSPYHDYCMAQVLLEADGSMGISPMESDWQAPSVAARCRRDLADPGLSPQTRTKAEQFLLTYLCGCLAFREMDVLPLCASIFRDFLNRKLPLRTQLLLYAGLSQLCLLQGSPDAVRWIGRTLQCTQALPHLAGDSWSVAPAVCALFYLRAGRPDLAQGAAQQALDSATETWHRIAAGCLDDHRISWLFLMLQQHTEMLYGILRNRYSVPMLYDHVLRFKDLAALTIRERNRLMQSVPVDGALKEKIFRLQDRLAVLQTDPDSSDGDIDAAEKQLLALEAEFYRRFPEENVFTPISPELVAEALAPGEAILEYYEYPAWPPGHTRNDQAIPIALDLYLLFRASEVSLLRLTVTDADSIVHMAEEFSRACQESEDLTLAGKKEALRLRLYETLLAPALARLPGVSTLYLAPSRSLYNLPFEILHGESTPDLADQMQVCRLLCGRDLIFRKHMPPASGAPFILGDPDYGPAREQERDFRSPDSGVSALPFSGLEARHIAARCHVLPCTGAAATKEAFRRAMPSPLIHLATHGTFRQEEEGLYGSGLVFAGYNRDASAGFLSADEISRMQLKGTHLTVLSACQSGLGDTDLGTSQGLVSSFSAAGVQWVVSHLWRADDLSAALFMDHFFSLLVRGTAVPSALAETRKYLRSVTLRELWAEGWFSPRNLAEYPVLRRLALRDPRRKPFTDERHWGGFIVHRCN